MSLFPHEESAYVSTLMEHLHHRWAINSKKMNRPTHPKNILAYDSLSNEQSPHVYTNSI